jgi:hypothetical protein
MPNPINVAYRCQFKLDIPIDIKKKRYIGTCICGIKASVSYDSLNKKTFCRNENCKYFQVGKRLDNEEMKIIIDERECQLVSLGGNGSKAVLDFICVCGFRQTSSWYHFYRERWCRYYDCEYYHNVKKLSTELAKDWIKFENYTVSEGFKYNSKYRSCDTRYELMCPVGHILHASISMWKAGSRCKICNGNGRSLSYQQIKNFYESHECHLLYSEEDHTGNVTTICVPYVCPKGHIIKNMTKNNFNSRINSDIGPCAICRTENRDRKTENIKTQKTMLKRYGVRNPSHVAKFIEKMCKTGYTSKKYTLPSGKEIDLMGDEPYCMDILLETYEEKEILTSATSVPTIWYMNPDRRKKSRYYCDMFIPSENIMVEVKSTWTLKKDKAKNEAKFKSSVKYGYKLHLYVFDTKKILLYRKIYTNDGVTVCPYPPANIVFEED